MPFGSDGRIANAIKNGYVWLTEEPCSLGGTTTAIQDDKNRVVARYFSRAEASDTLRRIMKAIQNPSDLTAEEIKELCSHRYYNRIAGG